MTWRPPVLTDKDAADLERRPQFRSSGALEGMGAIFGPSINALKRVPGVAQVLIPGLTLADATGPQVAMGSFGTYWVLDPANELERGIWAPNVLGEEDIKAAEKVGAPMVRGFYIKVGDLPAPAVMLGMLRNPSSGFQRDALERYKAFYPDAVADKSATSGTSTTPDVVVPMTYELSVSDNTIIVAKTEVESKGEDLHPGVALAGRGAWEKYVAGGKQPKDFGLPRRLLAMQEDGKVLPATEEYESIRAAAQQGDSGAQQALQYLKLSW